MSERISELLDGELESPEAQRQIAALKDNGELRRAWDTYHLIGDAMRGHVAMDLSAKVAARLRDEPAILAPRATPQLPQIRRWSYSAAAAVAAVAVVAWVASPVTAPESQMAQAPAVQPVPATSSPAAPPALAETGRASGVANYLLAHQRFSATSAM